MSRLHTWVNTYIALAYLRFRYVHTGKDEYYWKNSAIADAAVILFFGPMSAWLPYAVFTGSFGPSRGRLFFAAITLSIGALALIVAYAFARSGKWKEIAARTPTPENWPNRLT